MFAGTVITSFDEQAGSPIISGGDPIVYTFVVSHIWKGVVQDTLSVTSARMSAACGFTFRIGEDYLVYAYTHDDGLFTGHCRRTSEARLAMWDRYELPDPVWSRQDAVWERLSFDDLVAALSSGDTHQTANAIAALASVSEERGRVIELFRQTLHGGQPNSILVLWRLRALEADWKLLEPDIMWVLENGTPDERGGALAVMQELVTPEEFCNLLVSCADDREIRGRWIQQVWPTTCSTKQQERLFNTVLESLGDSDDYVRYIAVAVMERFGERALSSIPTLTEMMKTDVDYAVRATAANMLERLARMQQDGK